MSARGTQAGKSKVAHWCSLDEKAGTHALQRVQTQLLQKVGSRAQAVPAEEEQRAIVHKVQRQVQQQVGAKAQAVRTVEEGMEMSRGQQVRQGEETTTPQDEDSS